MEEDEGRKIIRDQYKKVKQDINRMCFLEPMLGKKKRELGRDLTGEEKAQVLTEADAKVKKRNEEKGI